MPFKFGAGVACGYTTPLQGIGRYSSTVHQQGCAGVACNSNQLFGAAETVARQADATVLVMGLDQSIEAEFRDRAGLLLPGHQQELVSRVAMASRGPTILVLMSGGPIDVSFAKNDPRIAAILWAGYPGQAGGQAIADVLFGTVNPGTLFKFQFLMRCTCVENQHWRTSLMLFANFQFMRRLMLSFRFLGGKLPMTWYPQDYVAKIPMTNMNMRANPARGYPGRTYRFYKGPVVYPFGYGMSYTAYRHSLVEAPTQVSMPLASLNVAVVARNSSSLSTGIKAAHVNCDAASLEIHVDVKNTGSMDGTHALLVFSEPSEGKWSPAKQLIGFEKVHVPAGLRRRVRVGVRVCEHLSVVDQFGIRRIPIGEHKLRIGDLEHSMTLQANLE